MENKKIHGSIEKPHGHSIVEQPQHEDRVEPAAARTMKEDKHRVCAERRRRKANTHRGGREVKEIERDEENTSSCRSQKHERFDPCCFRYTQSREKF